MYKYINLAVSLHSSSQRKELAMRTARWFLLVLFVVLTAGQSNAGEACGKCHGNAEKMKDAGYPQFTLSSEEVKAQTHMTASCSDCHLGNPGDLTREGAHAGLLTLQAVRKKTWEVVTRNSMAPEDVKSWPDLEPRGDGRATQLFPKRMYDGILMDNPDYKSIIYHDKNSTTFAFNPRIAEKTCGTCHGEIVKSFLKSPMGGGTGAHTQDQYRTWTGRTGPQSCGLWMGVLSKPDQDRFTDENIRNYNAHSTMQISEKDAYNSQRNCNQCHVGCIDCHLDVRKKDPEKPGDGPHTFVKKPAALACYGGGRSFSCHAGPLERRRGDGYIRAEFTKASREGTALLKDKPDIHMQKNIACVDCHEPNRETGFHGDLKRNVACGKCHATVVRAHKKGPHRKVDCASCHTALIGGYAFNFWSAVGLKGKENPLTRIQDYLTGATTPLLIKNPKGVWIPVHVVPHLSGNVKADEVRISKRLFFRNRPDSDVQRLYVSNDSYAVTGLVRNLDDRDHDVMTWLNIDRVAHGTGKARTCESCHASRTQKIAVKFSGGSYKDVENGEYTIIADEKGLRIADIKDDKGAALPDLVPLRDAWGLAGDFLLPGLKDQRQYERIKKKYEDGTFSH
jgi:hypothetical protein